VGRNKDIRKKIQGHRRQIALHEEKIQRELSKPNPDYDAIRDWQTHIRKHEMLIERLEKKLP
jgi:hypothetical protein